MQLVSCGRSQSYSSFAQYLRRYASNESKDGFRRFMQTIRVDAVETPSYKSLAWTQPRWSLHKLALPDTAAQPIRRSRALRFKNVAKPESVLPSNPTIELPLTTTTPEISPKKRRPLRPRKALITLSPSAIAHLKCLLDLPTPQLIRIGVRNRGCSGLSYHLEYVTEPGKFDERIDQDGVTILIDSKALFSIVGSEMDWLDDKLSSRFVFKNPNSKGTCGCGESFMV